MKLFPTSGGAKLRCLGILAIGFYLQGVPLCRLAFYQPKDGDLIFQSLPHADLVDAIEGVTQSPFSHCGVVMRGPKGWQVVESIGNVHETPLWWWVMRGRRGRFEVYRLRNDSRLDVPKLQTALNAFRGRDYDYHYAPGDDEIYCSELAYKAYDWGLGIEIGKFERLGDLNWKPSEALIRKMEGGAGCRWIGR